MDTTLLLFSGLAGTGKSTLAKLVAQKLQVPLFAFDHLIDYALPRQYWNAPDITEEALWQILYSFVELQLSIGMSAILDAIFFNEGRAQVKAIAERQRARFRVIHTFCSDESLWRERVLGRAEVALANETPARWEVIQHEREKYQPWSPAQALFVDAVQPVEENLKRVLLYIIDGKT